MMATMSDAHREWHLNSGVPVGLPGCPQDACHIDESMSRSEINRLVRQREINFAHMRGEQGSATISCAHCHGIHLSIGYVRECARKNSVEVPVHHPEPVRPSEETYLDWSIPTPPVADPLASVREARERREREEAEAKRARYAAWRSIPVYAGGRAYYALEMGGVVHFFKVSRPKKGPHAGKTFVEEQAGDAFHKMGWVRTGEVLDAIAADPDTAGRLYGLKIEKCYRCHKTLTDTDSRERGMGPDCAKKG